jgi:hypothetical protein
MPSVRYTSAAIAVIAGLLNAGNVAAEPVTFTKDAPLRSQARFDAAPVAQIKQGTVGDATAKQGPWLNIKTPEAAGWALTTDISFGTGGAGQSSSSGGTFLGRLFGGRQQASATSTIGIRGFDKETIGNALGEGGSVSTAQLALLDGYAVSKEGGQSFASSQGLSAAGISY